MTPVNIFVEATSHRYKIWMECDGSLRRIGPALDDHGKAIRIAGALAQAMRDEGVELLTAITIENAEILVDTIEENIDGFYGLIMDSKQREIADMSTAAWSMNETLCSIIDQVQKTDRATLKLDFDQASSVAEILPEAIQNWEESGNEPGEIIDTLIGYARQLEFVGFPFRQSYGRTAKFSIRLASVDSENRYAVWSKEREIETVPTLDAGWKLIMKSLDPPIGTQLEIPS